MGSNIHIVGPKNVEVTLAPLPEELGVYGNSGTLPRFTHSYKFMDLLWSDPSTVIVLNCNCKGSYDYSHDYFCDGHGRYRPTDFIKLKQDVKSLDDVFSVLVNYLESEPNAWVEYD